jgi:hypothetical protein
MRESCTYGSVRGAARKRLAASKGGPYRDRSARKTGEAIPVGIVRGPRRKDVRRSPGGSRRTFTHHAGLPGSACAAFVTLK